MKAQEKKNRAKDAIDATRTTSENSAGAVTSLDWMITLVTRAGKHGNIGLEIAPITTANHNNLLSLLIIDSIPPPTDEEVNT